MPEVIVDFECADGLLYVQVENVGDAPAHGVSVEFDKELIGSEGRKMSSLNLFRNLGFLPPKKRIRAFIDTWQSYVAREQPMKIRVTAAYHGKDGQGFTERMTHDLSIYQDLPDVSSQPR